MSIKKKLVVYLITLGLSLNGFCMNLLVPSTAMAISMNAPVSTMTAETAVHFGNSDMAASLNCCLAPMNHESDKSFEIKTPQETRQHLNILGINVGLVHVLKTNGNGHLRLYQYLEGNFSPPSLTGQIVKKE